MGVALADLEAELEPAQLGDGHLGRLLRRRRRLGGALSPALLLLNPVVAGLLSVAPPSPPVLPCDQVQLLEALAERRHRLGQRRPVGVLVPWFIS